MTCTKRQAALARVYEYANSRYNAFFSASLEKDVYANDDERSTTYVAIQLRQLCECICRTLNLMSKDALDAADSSAHLSVHYAMQEAVLSEMATQFAASVQPTAGSLRISFKEMVINSLAVLSPLYPGYRLGPVSDFMQKVGQPVRNVPTAPDFATASLRAKLGLEELNELINGLGVTVMLRQSPSLAYQPEGASVVELDNCDVLTQGIDGRGFSNHFNWEEIVDGLCDCDVIRDGTIISLGLSPYMLQLCRVLIDISNLDKFGEGGYRREDGKWVKPANWQKPPIADVLIMFGLEVHSNE